VSDADPSVSVFLDRFAAELGVDPPTADDIDAVLALAAVAAHASARQAAPVACWLAARAGVSVDAATAIAHRLADEPA
jgi:Domain of unknown function (DUF6457)